MPLMQTMFQPMMDVERVDADEDAERFRLKATGGGGFAKMLGLGTKATITVDASGFRLEKTRFGVNETTFIPRSMIASTVCVEMKPMELLIIGVLTLPLLGLGLIFIIAYFLGKKRIIVGAVSAGSTVESVKLKAKGETLEDIREGMRILEELLQGDAPASVPPESFNSLATADEKTTTECPHCGARMGLPQSGIGRRVRCLSCKEVFTAEESD